MRVCGHVGAVSAVKVGEDTQHFRRAKGRHRYAARGLPFVSFHIETVYKASFCLRMG